MYSNSVIAIFSIILVFYTPDILSANFFLSQLQAISGGLANSFNRNSGNSQINVMASGRKKSAATEPPSLAKALSEASKDGEKALPEENSTPKPLSPSTNGNPSDSSEPSAPGESPAPESVNRAENTGQEVKPGDKYEKEISYIFGGTANSMNKNTGNSFINVQNIEHE